MGHEHGVFGCEAESGGGSGVDGGNLVEQVRQPHKLRVVVDVEAKHRVVDGLVADVHLFGERLLGEVEHGGADGEILVEGILHIEAQECLALGGEERLVLKCHGYALTRVDDALVGDGDDTHRIIDGIVGVLGQAHAAGHHHYRAAGHVHGVEAYLRAGGCLIGAGEDKLVLVGKLAGDYQRGVVQLFVDIFLRQHGVVDFPLQVAAERLCHGEDNLAVGGIDGVPLDEVEESVGVALLVGVDAVEVHHLQQRSVRHRSDGEVVDEGAGGVGEILDAELEVLALHLVCAERVDVLHHQPPDGHLGVDGGGFEHLHVEALRGGGDVGGKFAHLINLAVVGVFVGYAQHVVGVELRFQRHIAEGGVESVFRGGEESGRLDFLVVAATLYAECAQRLQRLGDGVDRPGTGILCLDCLQQVVGGVGGHGRCGVDLPVGVVQPLGSAFAKVGESHDVARLVIFATFVGDPDFHTGNVDARRHQRQPRCEVVVVAVEIVAQEEVAVLVVLVGVDGKFGGLGAALCIHGLRLGILLRHKTGDGELAELQFGFRTEKGCASANK